MRYARFPTHAAAWNFAMKKEREGYYCRKPRFDGSNWVVFTSAP